LSCWFPFEILQDPGGGKLALSGVQSIDARLICRSLIVAVAGVAAVSVASCSQYIAPELPPKRAVVPVSGAVHVDGAPVEGVVVTLRPAAADDGLYQYPTALTDAEGLFVLGTYAEGDGAPAGEYVAVFEWPLPEEEQVTEVDRLKRLYSDPKKSKFKVTVEEEALVLEVFELKVQGSEGAPLSRQDLKDLKIRYRQRAMTQ
jgi:hypothetical protein